MNEEKTAIGLKVTQKFRLSIVCLSPRFSPLSSSIIYFLSSSQPNLPPPPASHPSPLCSLPSPLGPLWDFAQSLSFLPYSVSLPPISQDCGRIQRDEAEKSLSPVPSTEQGLSKMVAVQLFSYFCICTSIPPLHSEFFSQG